MKEMYAQLGISSEVYDFGKKIEDSLKERFEKVNFDQVKNDAEHFVFKNEDLSFYSKELFLQMLDRI